ncbi:hypothetical protein BpHYR1_028165 [Brachionus plicatilis]|uniref:Uncharacterized protein n=1 Tax=Brachionus plicatilis TaxID=10195 RepID=A0A3M7Q947_BRAPC|nr:hypothetical protein BpHYR1_028165 [Brachionus plicatilis]
MCMSGELASHVHVIVHMQTLVFIQIIRKIIHIIYLIVVHIHIQVLVITLSLLISNLVQVGSRPHLQVEPADVSAHFGRHIGRQRPTASAYSLVHAGLHLCSEARLHVLVGRWHLLAVGHHRAQGLLAGQCVAAVHCGRVVAVHIAASSSSQKLQVAPGLFDKVVALFVTGQKNAYGRQIDQSVQTILSIGPVLVLDKNFVHARKIHILNGLGETSVQVNIVGQAVHFFERHAHSSLIASNSLRHHGPQLVDSGLAVQSQSKQFVYLECVNVELENFHTNVTRLVVLERLVVFNQLDVPVDVKGIFGVAQRFEHTYLLVGVRLLDHVVVAVEFEQAQLFVCALQIVVQVEVGDYLLGGLFNSELFVHVDNPVCGDARLGNNHSYFACILHVFSQSFGLHLLGYLLF